MNDMNRSTASSLLGADPHLQKRYRREMRFRCYGIAALAFSMMMLVLLLGAVVIHGVKAFYTTEIKLEITLDPEVLDHDHTGDTKAYRFAPVQKLVKTSLKTLFPDVTERKDAFQLYMLVSRDSSLTIQNAALEGHAPIGHTIALWLQASSGADAYIRHGEKGHVSPQQIAWLDALKQQGRIRTTISENFFSNADSRDPSVAGILGSFIGSLFTVFSCMLVSFPFGVAAAVYLQEFAAKNRLTDLIEVNINNLAAVPSIVFGLLGLSIFLTFFGMPRSSPLVGGFTLAMLVLPTIIIATRNALKAVPSSIRDAARALGATDVQVLLHHTLPLALPGIMTGTILSIARALGETAPLLMIGMVAFIADVPSSLADPATTLPVQIYLWSDNPEAGFVEKTSGCIVVLLALLAVLNFAAAAIRNRFEVKW